MADAAAARGIVGDPNAPLQFNGAPNGMMGASAEQMLVTSNLGEYAGLEADPDTFLKETVAEAFAKVFSESPEKTIQAGQDPTVARDIVKAAFKATGRDVTDKEIDDIRRQIKAVSSEAAMANPSLRSTIYNASRGLEDILGLVPGNAAPGMPNIPQGDINFSESGVGAVRDQLVPFVGKGKGREKLDSVYVQRLRDASDKVTGYDVIAGGQVVGNFSGGKAPKQDALDLAGQFAQAEFGMRYMGGEFGGPQPQAAGGAGGSGGSNLPPVGAAAPDDEPSPSERYQQGALSGFQGAAEMYGFANTPEGQDAINMVGLAKAVAQWIRSLEESSAAIQKSSFGLAEDIAQAKGTVQAFNRTIANQATIVANGEMMADPAAMQAAAGAKVSRQGFGNAVDQTVLADPALAGSQASQDADKLRLAERRKVAKERELIARGEQDLIPKSRRSLYPDVFAAAQTPAEQLSDLESRFRATSKTLASAGDLTFADPKAAKQITAAVSRDFRAIRQEVLGLNISPTANPDEYVRLEQLRKQVANFKQNILGSYNTAATGGSGPLNPNNTNIFGGGPGGPGGSNVPAPGWFQRVKNANQDTPAGFFGSGALSTVKYGLPGMLLYGGLDLFKDSLREAQEFQFALTKIQNQIEATFGGDSAAITEKYSNIILNTSKNTGIAADELAKMSVQIIGAFKDVPLDFGSKGMMTGEAAIQGQIDAASKIATVTGLPLKEINDGLQATSLAYGMSYEQIGNIATRLESTTGVSANEIFNMTGDIAPVAQTSGYQLEEIMSLMAAVASRTGRSGAAIAESFGRILPGISDRKPELYSLAVENSGAFDSNFYQDLSNNNLKGVLEGLGKAYTATDAQGNFILGGNARKEVESSLGGRREAQILIPALSQGARVKDLANDALNNSDGGLEKRFEVIRGSIQNTIERLVAQIRTLFVELIESGIGDVIKDVAAGFGLILRAVSPIVKLWTQFNDILGGIPTKLAAIGLLFKTLKWSGLIPSNALDGGRDELARKSRSSKVVDTVLATTPISAGGSGIDPARLKDNGDGTSTVISPIGKYAPTDMTTFLPADLRQQVFDNAVSMTPNGKPEEVTNSLLARSMQDVAGTYLSGKEIKIGESQPLPTTSAEEIVQQRKNAERMGQAFGGRQGGDFPDQPVRMTSREMRKRYMSGDYFMDEDAINAEYADVEKQVEKERKKVMGLSQSPAERQQRLDALDTKLSDAQATRDSKLQNIKDVTDKVTQEEGLVRDQQLNDIMTAQVPVPGEPGRMRGLNDEEKAQRREAAESSYNSRVRSRISAELDNGTELKRSTATLRGWGNSAENARRRLDKMGEGFANFWKNNIYGKQTLRDDQGNEVTRRTGAFAGFGNMKDEYKMLRAGGAGRLDAAGAAIESNPLGGLGMEAVTVGATVAFQAAMNYGVDERKKRIDKLRKGWMTGNYEGNVDFSKNVGYVPDIDNRNIMISQRQFQANSLLDERTGKVEAEKVGVSAVIDWLGARITGGETVNEAKQNVRDELVRAESVSWMSTVLDDQSSRRAGNKRLKDIFGGIQGQKVVLGPEWLGGEKLDITKEQQKVLDSKEFQALTPEARKMLLDAGDSKNPLGYLNKQSKSDNKDTAQAAADAIDFIQRSEDIFDKSYLDAIATRKAKNEEIAKTIEAISKGEKKLQELAQSLASGGISAQTYLRVSNFASDAAYKTVQDQIAADGTADQELIDFITRERKARSDISKSLYDSQLERAQYLGSIDKNISPQQNLMEQFSIVNRALDDPNLSPSAGYEYGKKWIDLQKEGLRQRINRQTDVFAVGGMDTTIAVDPRVQKAFIKSGIENYIGKDAYTAFDIALQTSAGQAAGRAGSVFGIQVPGAGAPPKPEAGRPWESGSAFTDEFAAAVQSGDPAQVEAVRRKALLGIAAAKNERAAIEASATANGGNYTDQQKERLKAIDAEVAGFSSILGDAGQTIADSIRLAALDVKTAKIDSLTALDQSKNTKNARARGQASLRGAQAKLIAAYQEGYRPGDPEYDNIQAEINNNASADRDNAMADIRSNFSLNSTRFRNRGQQSAGALENVKSARANLEDLKRRKAGIAELNAAREELDNAEKAFKDALVQEFAIFQTTQQKLRGTDALDIAQTNVVIAKNKYDNSEGYDKLVALGELVDAMRQQRRAEVSRANSFTNLDSSINAKDPIKVADNNIEIAQRELDMAKEFNDIEGQNNAQAKLNEAIRARQEAMNQARLAGMQLRQAELQAMGDEIGAAKESEKIIKQQIADALALGAPENSTEVLGLKAQLVAAERATQDAINQSNYALMDMRKAQLEANQDAIGVADMDVALLQQQLQDTIRLGAPQDSAEVRNLRAQITRAQTAAADTRYNETKDDFMWQYNMEKITRTQLIQYLEGLKTTLIPGTRQFKDLELEIKRLKDDISGNLEMNIPTSIKLPTLYEVRRLNQSNPENKITAGGNNQYDNRSYAPQITIVNPPSGAAIAEEVGKGMRLGTSGNETTLY